MFVPSLFYYLEHIFLLDHWSEEWVVLYDDSTMTFFTVSFRRRKMVKIVCFFLHAQPLSKYNWGLVRTLLGYQAKWWTARWNLLQQTKTDRSYFCLEMPVKSVK